MKDLKDIVIVLAIMGGIWVVGALMVLAVR